MTFLPDNQIGYSRDVSFEQMIMKETNGQGVDIVVNSFIGDKLQASIRCVKYGGQFMELGKYDLANDSPLRLELIKKEASYSGVMLDILVASFSFLRTKLRHLMDSGLKDGSIKPITTVTFEKDQAIDAFRHMAAGKHIGKVVIKIRDEEQNAMNVPAKKTLFKGVPKHFSTLNATYIVTGGLGGFGLELVDWLVMSYVQNIVISSRKGVTTKYQRYRLESWKQYGVNIKISTADITTPDGCRSLMQEAAEQGPVAAIFHLAVVLKDGLFDNQTVETFQTSFAPKVNAVKNLDEISRRLCPDLKYYQSGFTINHPPILLLFLGILLCFRVYRAGGEMRDKPTTEWRILLWKGFARNGRIMDIQLLPSSGGLLEKYSPNDCLFDSPFILV